MTPRHRLDLVGAVAAVVAVLGIVFDRALLPLWAFLLLFGITTVPERMFRWLRQRRAARR